MDVVFILSFIPIFFMLLLPVFFLRDARFIAIWLLVSALGTWQISSQISSFAHEQWSIVITCFTNHPLWEAIKLTIMSALCLVGVAALLFSLYFVPIFIIYRIEREAGIQLRNQLAWVHRPRNYETVRLYPVSSERIRKILEEDEA